MASHAKFVLKFNDTYMQRLALEMGTSVKMLEANYIDYPKIPHLDMNEMMLNPMHDLPAVAEPKSNTQKQSKQAKKAVKDAL